MVIKGSMFNSAFAGGTLNHLPSNLHQLQSLFLTQHFHFSLFQLFQHLLLQPVPAEFPTGLWCWTEASLHELQNFSLFFKVKRAFCCATSMSCFIPSVFCPLHLRAVPESLLQIWVPFEQSFCSSSWDRKNTLLSVHSPSAVLPPLPRKLPVQSSPVCWGRAALGGTAWTLGR